MKRPLWVLIALLIAHFVIVLRHHARPLITDELYYFDRAHYFAQHGSFHPIIDNSTAGDWRPQGYSVFLGVLGLGAFDDPAAVRLRATIAQFALTAAFLIATFLLFARSTGDARAHWIAAIVFGLAPWPFEYANDIGPDEIIAPIIAFGLLLLWRARGGASLFAAMFVISLTLLFRPEMIVLAPLIALAAFWIARRWNVRDFVVAALAFAIVLGAQVAYRTAYLGRLSIFGKFQLFNAGAFAWTRTWFGTEKEAYDFVYAISEGRHRDLPDRAFDDARERTLVESLQRDAEADGYSPPIDAAFQKLAEERARRHPIRTQLIRITNVIPLWINLETPSALLEELTPVPRPIRRTLLGGLLLLRIVIIVAGCAGAWRAWKRWRSDAGDEHDALTLLFFAYVVMRTLLIGIGFHWRVHRYVVSAWIPLLWCAARAFSRTPDRPSASSGREVFAVAGRGGDGGAAIAGEARPC